MSVLQCDNEDVQQSLLQHVMKIAVCKKDDQEDFSIVLEGVQVMTGLGNLTRACTVLFGFTYALNLTYPKQLRNTFEAFQSLLELDVCRYLQMLPVFLLINGVSLQDTVVGFIGGSAVLLCSSKEPQLTIQDVEVQWRHNNWNVYAIIKDKVAMEEQDAEYRNRTESFPAEYVRGNFSLKLNNLQYSDEGEYKCYISEDSIIQNIITVELLIKERETRQNSNEGTKPRPEMTVMISFVLCIGIIFSLANSATGVFM
ncbi:myelin-oligodendrocyte glycoprotein isoform X1 [Labeo rohita]|uniref:myelin-oligodendrocyte glycoprotein isoform X1 n=2 Tax=Labeo rohita TaxID=84645 RepID=UPI0021E23848|nr:myelin-oligodendrocyte glycoprotein isoform X1 [Labeo rohita]